MKKIEKQMLQLMYLEKIKEAEQKQHQMEAQSKALEAEVEESDDDEVADAYMEAINNTEYYEVFGETLRDMMANAEELPDIEHAIGLTDELCAMFEREKKNAEGRVKHYEDVLPTLEEKAAKDLSEMIDVMHEYISLLDERINLCK